MKEFLKINSSIYGPYPFWFLNYILEKKIIKEQLKKMKQKKIGGFLLHPRSGLLSPAYMTEGWFKIVKFIIKESKKLGLNIGIYDEFDCPSGTCGEIITTFHPEFRAKFLEIFRDKVKVEKKGYFYSIPEGEILKIFGLNKGKIYDLTEKIGVVKNGFSYSLNWSSKNYYNKIERDYKHPRAITIYPKFYIEFPNKGEWEILIFYINEKQKPSFTIQHYLDVLNPEATECFLKYTYESYKKNIGEYFGKNVNYFFIDEPKMFNEYPWTDKLEEIFKTKYGYSLIENLYHLVFNLGEKSEKLRIQYREVLTDLFINNFILKIKKWCNENNLKLIGHISPEEDITYEAYFIGSLLDALENFDIPGCDVIIPAIGDEKHKILNRTILLPSSIGEIKGTPVLCEAFGCSDWNFTPLTMKKLIDWMFALGINFIVPHAFFYSIVGLRKYEAGPSFFYQWTFWKYYNYISDYISRLSYIMQNTNPIAKICFLYPIKEIWKNLPEIEKSNKIEELLDEIIFKLITNHIRFHLITEKQFLNINIGENFFELGKIKYEILLTLKNTYISEECKNLISKLKEKNINVIEVDTKDEIFKIINNLKKNNNFSLIGKDSDKIFVNIKEKKGKFFYFMFNTSNRKIDILVKFKEKKGFEILDCYRGRKYTCYVNNKNNNTYIRLTFHPFESYLLSETNKILKHKYENLKIKKVPFKDEWRIDKIKNYFLIDEWEINLKDKIVKKRIPFSIYKIFPELFSKEWKETVFGRIPMGNVKKEKLEIKNYFNLQEKLRDKILLILEDEGIIGENYIYINGIKLIRFKKMKEYDMFMIGADITRYIKIGSNEIKIILYTDKLETGIYSPLILKGKFTIDEERKIIPYRNKILMTGSWTNQGFPYYSGTITYIQKIKIKKELLKAKKIYLQFPEVRDAVEVIINSYNVGVLLWYPFKIEIKKYLKEGNNEFKFLVTNSNYNTFYRKKIPSGIIKTPFLEFYF